MLVGIFVLGLVVHQSVYGFDLMAVTLALGSALVLAVALHLAQVWGAVVVLGTADCLLIHVLLRPQSGVLLATVLVGLLVSTSLQIGYQQRCCSGVGSVCEAKLAPVSATCIVLTLSVPRSVSSVRKLCTGRSSAVRLRAALARAAGERLAGATTERRRCSPACGSCSSAGNLPRRGGQMGPRSGSASRFRGVRGTRTPGGRWSESSLGRSEPPS